MRTSQMGFNTIDEMETLQEALTHYAESMTNDLAFRKELFTAAEIETMKEKRRRAERMTRRIEILLDVEVAQ
jgi:hypothetical protein